MSDPRTTPTDGNPPAPIRRRIDPPIGKGFALEQPDHPLGNTRMKLTIAGPFPVGRGNFAAANEARRAVHSGATSHDCESAA